MLERKQKTISDKQTELIANAALKICNKKNIEVYSEFQNICKMIYDNLTKGKMTWKDIKKYLVGEINSLPEKIPWYDRDELYNVYCFIHADIIESWEDLYNHVIWFIKYMKKRIEDPDDVLYRETFYNNKVDIRKNILYYKWQITRDFKNIDFHNVEVKHLPDRETPTTFIESKDDDKIPHVSIDYYLYTNLDIEDREYTQEIAVIFCISKNEKKILLDDKYKNLCELYKDVIIIFI